jgi:hypothetical protein
VPGLGGALLGETSCRLPRRTSAPTLAVPGAREILAALDEPIEVDGML